MSRQLGINHRTIKFERKLDHLTLLKQHYQSLAIGKILCLTFSVYFNGNPVDTLVLIHSYYTNKWPKNNITNNAFISQYYYWLSEQVTIYWINLFNKMIKKLRFHWTEWEEWPKQQLCGCCSPACLLPIKRRHLNMVGVVILKCALNTLN